MRWSITVDLFSSASKTDKKTENSYTAQDIEVLEGLEPVRLRPGMYIGGTDEAALHHLVTEVLDNAMDEAVAGYATIIEITLHENGSITISDNGRGIPIEPHPKFPDKSALEVIFTTLHAGGKFNNKVYETSGGLHGVGISVVNALSAHLQVEVVREKRVWQQRYAKGHVLGPLEEMGAAPKGKKGTTVTFSPDLEIFDTGIIFRPKKLYKEARAKAYLYKGVEIKWYCASGLLSPKDMVPEQDSIHFPNGLKDYLQSALQEDETVAESAFSGEVKFGNKKGRVEWALHWLVRKDGALHSYCNTVSTVQGGTHETGLRNALLKGIKEFAAIIGHKKAGLLTAEDIMEGAFGIVSLFIPAPQFQGQTKDKLSNREVIKLVEHAIKDHFDHWLSGHKTEAGKLLEFFIAKAEQRISRKQYKETARKTVMQRLRLPGKLADCTRQQAKGTEVFLVEGDSAGGSAKMARNRETQAVLPLRGKILNVASAGVDKINANQELSDIELAFGCGTKEAYREDELRYEKIIIMTDADVDGAHIASLLMTYFFKFMPNLIKGGHLYLASPPLFRLIQGSSTYYVNTEEEKDQLVIKLQQSKKKIELSRFKGLGEMTAAQLKETTMDPKTRRLLKIVIDPEYYQDTSVRVEELMGKKPELRFKFISEQSALMSEQLERQLDV